MTFLARSRLAYRRWTKHPLRRVWIAAGLLFFAGATLFSIGQLEAYQSMPLVKPFHHAGNKTGILLIHGFGGSPVEVQPLADSLAGEGFTVDVPLLPGHGTTPRDFAATRNAQFLDAVRGELGDLRAHCDRVYVVGFSMGGLLALQLEQESRLDGLVLMNTPIQPWNDYAEFNCLKFIAEGGTRIHLFIPTLGIPDLLKAGRREWGDVPSSLIEPNYAAYPAISCLRILNLIEHVKTELPRITAPTLILQSQEDHIAAPSSARYLYDHIGSSEKSLVYLPHSGHVLALGPERGKVEAWVDQFVSQGTFPTEQSRERPPAIRNTRR